MSGSSGHGRRIAVAAALAVALLAPAAAPASAAPACDDANAHPGEVGLSEIKDATLCLLNRERTSRDRRKLTGNDRLAGAARSHALDMVERGYFAHTAPGGVDFVRRIMRRDYVQPGDGWAVGENLAWGSYELATPREIVRSWMDSPPHRANILNGRYKEIGIGVARGAPERGVARAATYVTEFGARF
jgi:uncharacterized protein YkwD